MDLKEEEVLGKAIDQHWYYLSKAEVLRTYVPKECRRVLDVGAGAGWFSKWLLRNGLAEEAVCIDPGYPEDRSEIESGRPIRFVRAAEKSSCDLVLMMDVLEHVDDDSGLLANYLDHVPSGTPVFITVPAFQFLWSKHDEFLEHRRRYTVSSLSRTVLEAGAQVDRMHYYFASVLPPAALLRLARKRRPATESDMKVHSPIVNGLLKAACALERPFMRANRLAGLSVVCVCSRH